MNITPLIPDGYSGPIKQLTCPICKHVFYIAQDDYQRLPEIRFCHECSLILREELEKTQGASTLTPPPVREKPVARTPIPSAAAPIQPIPLPQPRTIDREKMTVEQLLEEAEMLCKTWRYKEALRSYEEVLQRDPQCLKALYGRASMLSIWSEPIFPDTGGSQLPVQSGHCKCTATLADVKRIARHEQLGLTSASLRGLCLVGLIVSQKTAGFC